MAITTDPEILTAAEVEIARERYMELARERTRVITKHVFTVIGLIHEKHGYEHPSESVIDTLPCPICAMGSIRYVISTNRGITRFRCSTPQCIAYMA